MASKGAWRENVPPPQIPPMRASLPGYRTPQFWVAIRGSDRIDKGIRRRLLFSESRNDRANARVDRRRPSYAQSLRQLETSQSRELQWRKPIADQAIHLSPIQIFKAISLRT